MQHAGSSCRHLSERYDDDDTGTATGLLAGEGEGEGEREREGEGAGVMINYTIHDWSQHGEEVAFDVEAKADTGPTCRAVVTLAFDGERLFPTFDDVERWVSAELLAFFTAYSEDPACEVEDGLLDELCSAVDIDELDFDGSCPECAGSGEGMYDGSRCMSCRGSGTERRGGRDDDE